MVTLAFKKLNQGSFLHLQTNRLPRNKETMTIISDGRAQTCPSTHNFVNDD